MPFVDLFKIIVSALLGGVMGGLVAWGGIRIRLDHLERKMSSLSKSVVYRDTCEQCRTNIDGRHTEIKDDIREIKGDIKKLLGRRAADGS